MSTAGIPSGDRRAVGLHSVVLIVLAGVIAVVAIATQDPLVVLLVAAVCVVAGRALTGALRARVAPATMSTVEQRYSRIGSPLAIVAFVGVAAVLLTILLG